MQSSRPKFTFEHELPTPSKQPVRDIDIYTKTHKPDKIVDLSLDSMIPPGSLPSEDNSNVQHLISQYLD
jgi:hypothetical protein